MTDQQTSPVQPEIRSFLPLGSVVILKGSVKKLLIVSRGSIVKDEFFDYGAFLYPEGMIDSNIVYFTHDDILKVVHEGYADTDDELVLEILNDAYARYQQEKVVNVPAFASPNSVPVPTPAEDDPFAGVRDLGGDDE